MKLNHINKISIFSSLLLVIVYFMTPSSAYALTVAEVVKDLACPCQCPLILEDCNMTCGLEWKNEVGELVKKGMSKKEIMEYFIDKYGEDARLTPMQRIDGKIYQYTRGFDTVDWVLLWAGVLGWASLMFFGIYLGTRKLFLHKSKIKDKGHRPIERPI